MKTILLKFSGPMQSWGTTSKLDNKRSDTHPSKSAVIGIIAAALGYTRDMADEIKVLNELDFGVRVDKEGTLLKDFHNARLYKKTGEVISTYLTDRYYLEDAVFLCGVSSEDEELINTIYEGLKKPYFQLYLGRKSCPINYDYLRGIHDGGVYDNLIKYERLNNLDTPLVAYLDSRLVEYGVKKKRSDVVDTTDPYYRKFKYRFETEVVISKGNEDKLEIHDLFSYLERV